MGWKASGQPAVRKQRDRWVVRLDGIDTETGKHRPRQLGTYASQRAGRTAASTFATDGAEKDLERGAIVSLSPTRLAVRDLPLS